jgi:hypothetical protein
MYRSEPEYASDLPYSSRFFSIGEKIVLENAFLRKRLKQCLAFKNTYFQDITPYYKVEILLFH